MKTQLRNLSPLTQKPKEAFHLINVQGETKRLEEFNRRVVGAPVSPPTEKKGEKPPGPPPEYNGKSLTEQSEKAPASEDLVPSKSVVQTAEFEPDQASSSHGEMKFIEMSSTKRGSDVQANAQILDQISNMGAKSKNK